MFENATTAQGPSESRRATTKALGIGRSLRVVPSCVAMIAISAGAGCSERAGDEPAGEPSAAAHAHSGEIVAEGIGAVRIAQSIAATLHIPAARARFVHDADGRIRPELGVDAAPAQRGMAEVE